ncbi:MAG: thiolase family protein [Planctomycetota bacterium]
MERVAVVRAFRTPIGKYLGGLSKLSVADLGAAVVRPLIDGLDTDVQELIFGCARQAGQGPNPARQVAIGAGLPQTTVAHTLNMACGSGLKAIGLAAEQIQLGRASAVIAGGVESMSGVPFLLDRMRTGYRLGSKKLIDGMYQDGFHCPLSDQLMGATAETLADQYEISRTEQDQFALDSQAKAAAAIEAGAFDNEIVPVETKKGIIEKDEHPRPGSSLEKIGKLPPVFRDNGTVHAGNSSGITDGAAAVFLASESLVREKGWTPLAWFDDYTVSGVDPKVMGIGPVPAVAALLERTGDSLEDFGLIELNEAFAAQVIACEKELGFDREKLNVHGGSIALGHPIGCTGARIVVTLLHAMERHGVKKGLATLCVSGGLGVAASFTLE